MDQRTDFEGRTLPVGSALRAALCGDGPTRAWLVRAAVVHPPFTALLMDTAGALFADADADARAAALEVAAALNARPLLARLVDALEARPEDWLTGPPGATPGHRALAFVERAAPPRSALRRRALAWALTQPALQLAAWRGLGMEHPDLLVPHLPDVLAAAPELADPLATRLALVHTDHCEAACRALAPAPEDLRRAFAAPLEKHLRRIFAIKKWVACRRALFGR
ncbi:MAG: hypothetical protein H6704_21610 [Myxococcales bacterium]|nr:hypothetical protein [Myxococcales bacterium]